MGHVSARGKKTDELVQLAAEITNTPSAREMDMLLSTGEQVSAALMAMAALFSAIDDAGGIVSGTVSGIDGDSGIVSGIDGDSGINGA